VKEFHGDRKSISKERTFVKDTNNFYLILSELNKINEQINIEVKKGIFSIEQLLAITMT
jgi:hypothetical protein